MSLSVTTTLAAGPADRFTQAAADNMVGTTTKIRMEGPLNAANTGTITAASVTDDGQFLVLTVRVEA